MIVGCYTLDLYCDSEGCSYNSRDGAYEPDQFTGETVGSCRQQARVRGWKLHLRTGRAWCPKCR